MTREHDSADAMCRRAEGGYWYDVRMEQRGAGAPSNGY
jgi:hypothetical protein